MMIQVLQAYGFYAVFFGNTRVSDYFSDEQAAKAYAYDYIAVKKEAA